MNFAEARSLAVTGHRVRAIDMQPGAFVYYDFAGLRIYIGGNSSGWSPRAHDEEVEWEVVPYDAPDPMDIPQYAQMIGRATRGAGGKNVLIEDFAQTGAVLIIKPRDKWGNSANDAFEAACLGVPAAPDPAPANVGKWGTAAVPKRDAWGRPTD